MNYGFFRSILLLQGIINNPTNDMYWSNNPFLVTPVFSCLMERDDLNKFEK